jgi:hypothetical protein
LAPVNVDADDLLRKFAHDPAEVSAFVDQERERFTVELI